ncbi:MAG TPA: carbohydrate-binding protein [Ktedonobacteraceae bacterium]|nr:carbohydrate-binding protein [Ktedonobacteraceae bacterium]
MGKRIYSMDLIALAILGLLSLVVFNKVSPTHAQGLPNGYVAPYVDVTMNSTVGQDIQTSGVKDYTLAFVVDGGSCQATWAGLSLNDSSVQSIISTIRNAGGDVIASFGGEAGIELALNCPDPGTLQAQYQRVVNLGITHLDFDIEGGPLGYTSDNDKRNKAIAALEAANPGLTVSFTLPVLPSGLTQDGLNLVQNAVQNGVSISVVNIMAMDYYCCSSDMGQNAIDAANSTYNQLQGIIPNMSWSMIGVTPMIGVNDDTAEVFTEQDAQRLVTFAEQNHLGELSFWSEGRDNGGCPNGSVSPTCSGIQQNAFDFSSIFGQFAGNGGGGGGGGGSTPTPTPTSPASPTPTTTGTPVNIPAWQPWTHYNVGDEVTYNGVVYTCIQAHTSEPGWEPPNVPALWKPAS